MIKFPWTLKMILIYHRGNKDGPDDAAENNPYFLNRLIRNNSHIEIDLWMIDGILWLGHDRPQYKIHEAYLDYENFWIHAKNLDALEYLTSTGHKYFWHQEDDFTLTSNNKIWTYPDKEVTGQSIIVCRNLEECNKYKDKDIFGICSDYISLMCIEGY